jgi:hypothetical protein
MITLSSFKSSPEYQEVITKNQNTKTSQNPPKKLIGKWVMDGDLDTYINLRSDGSVIEKSLGAPLKRYWRLKDSKLCLKGTSAKSSAEICLEYELRDDILDILVITMNEMELHYIRNKE